MCQKKALGFQNEYITIYKGSDLEQFSDYFKRSSARWARWWGWYLPSTEPDIVVPEGVEAFQLPWSLVGADDESLLPEEQVIEAVENLINPVDPNLDYVGEVKQRYNFQLLLVGIYHIDNSPYPTTLYLFNDQTGNELVWNTSTSKDIKIGIWYSFDATIKEHKIYRNRKQTILTNCRGIHELR